MSDGSILAAAIAFLGSMDGAALLGFFWFAIVFELPRYALGFPAVVIGAVMERRAPPAPTVSPQGRISVLIAGHNEADTIERCVRSLRAQSLQQVEIICVSDGSTDQTFAVMQRLRREGLIDRAAECQIRGGKPAALNLAASLASGSIFLVVDCDCSFAPNTLAELVAPFDDPQVGAVAGRVLVRNPTASMVTSLQAVEYLVGMTLGRAQLAMFGQLSLVSGAIGAFRASAWRRIGGMDPGPGEDFDACLRLRRAGWRIAFASRATAYTDVPVSLSALLRQRRRWERDALWIRLRKHGVVLNPFSPNFAWREVFHQVDFLLLTVLPTLILPFFLGWLFANHGAAAIVILLATSLALLVLDLAVLLCAVIADGDRRHWRLVFFLPAYGLFQAYLLRLARLRDFAGEWVFSSSRTDSYCPPKVNAWSNWR
jgi:cellulose synthase/poly-beta-1,6-N-acetylglucosamine synthase-like glycosyltransferase